MPTLAAHVLEPWLTVSSPLQPVLLAPLALFGLLFFLSDDVGLALFFTHLGWVTQPFLVLTAHGLAGDREISIAVVFLRLGPSVCSWSSLLHRASMMLNVICRSVVCVSSIIGFFGLEIDEV